ncbi:protein glxC [Oculatella sp. LEGE 06141]|uniref:GltB/FmdC/FwdC-like GXGXG domain-containing protein n=1 Tax=Oculatella sp. LEGE 06141 TaxID=1828648 RepID=UPI00188108DA|nr:protein glxC [Oculatella sp. LEGE 06141]MBE9178166.1 protein glxC [Oculatella sp. LEGE 06141]
METTLSKTSLDCTLLTTREINQQLKALAAQGVEQVDLINPAGRHNLAVAIDRPIVIQIHGAVGYYCGGLGDGSTIDIHGSCGWSVGENLMSGQIIVRGNASANVAASAHGGKVCILGHAGPRAAISLKGGTVVVTGNVGQSSAFMMQQGRFIVCGNAGDSLGDSIYDGEIFVGGEVRSLGADARIEPMTGQDWQTLNDELNPLGIDPHTHDFKKIVCAQELYHFKARDFSKWKDAY